MSYRTFKRSANSFEQFATATKRRDRSGLTIDEARDRCEAFNQARTPQQVAKGTKLEFEAE